jgi:AcrR family transcriptional regulator
MDVNQSPGAAAAGDEGEAESTPAGPAGGDPVPTGAPAAPDLARPRTKAGQREATTAALLAAARELFAERGYAAVAAEEIVQRAGVTRGALYHHFRGGKEDLFRAVLVQISAETVQHITRLAMEAEDPWASLVVGCEAFLDACASPDVQRIVLTDAPSVLGWDVRRAIDRDYGLGLLEAALQRAMDAGRVREGSATSLAYVLAGALDEAAMVVARADDPLEARVEMGRTVRRLLEGLRAP